MTLILSITSKWMVNALSWYYYKGNIIPVFFDFEFVQRGIMACCHSLSLKYKCIYSFTIDDQFKLLVRQNISFNSYRIWNKQNALDQLLWREEQSYEAISTSNGIDNNKVSTQTRTPQHHQQTVTTNQNTRHDKNGRKISRLHNKNPSQHH